MKAAERLIGGRGTSGASAKVALLRFVSSPAHKCWKTGTTRPSPWQRDFPQVTPPLYTQRRGFRCKAQHF